MDTTALPSGSRDISGRRTIPGLPSLSDFSTGTYDREPQPSAASDPVFAPSGPSLSTSAIEPKQAATPPTKDDPMRWIPRYHVVDGQVRLAPDFDFDEWKARLTPHERSLVDNDETGEAIEKVLARDRKAWTYIGLALKHHIDFEQALANNFDAFAFAHDRGMLRGDPLTWEAFAKLAGDSAKRFGRGAAVVAKQLDAELIAKTQYLLDPNEVTREVYAEERRGVAAQITASAYFTVRGIADLAHTLWGLDQKTRMWLGEKMGALSPAERQERLARMRYEAFKASVESTSEQSLLMESLAEFGHLAKEDVQLAGEFISAINPADPMAHVPIGKAFSLAGGMARRGLTKFLPGVTESLRVGLVKTAERRAVLEELVSKVEKSGEIGERLDTFRQKLAATVSAESAAKAAYHGALVSDAEAVRRAAGQTLGSRAGAAAFGLAGWTTTEAVEMLGRIETRADAFARKLGAERLGLGRVAVHGIGAATGAAAGAAFGAFTDEDHTAADAALGALVGAGAMTFRGKIGIAGEVSQKLSGILKAGTTTQTLFRKLAQETAELPITQHLANLFDPVMSANPVSRYGKLIFNAGLDTAGRTLKGAVGEALGAAAFSGVLTYAQEGTTGEDAMRATAAGGGQGFVMGAFRSFVAVPNRGVSFQNLEAEVAHFKQRAAGDSKYGPANLARFNELSDASQRSLAHFLHVNPEVWLLFTSHPEDVALARKVYEAKNDGAEAKKALENVDGAAFEHEGRRYILINPHNPDATLRRVIAHELRQTATDNPVIRRQIVDTLLGDASVNRPGLFTARDAAGQPIKVVRDGHEAYETVQHFKDAKAIYLGLLEDTLGVRKEMSDADFAGEYDAEATAAHWLNGGFEEHVRPTLSGALLGTLGEVPFLRRTIGSLGVPFRADFNVAAPNSVVGTFTVTRPMQKLADMYSTAWTRGIKDRARSTGISVHEQPATAHLLTGSLDLARRPDGTPSALVYADGDTRIAKGESLVRPREEIARDLAAQRATVEEAIAKSPAYREEKSVEGAQMAEAAKRDSLPGDRSASEGSSLSTSAEDTATRYPEADDARAVQPRDDAGTLAGTHLSEESLFHVLDSETFSDANKNTVAALNEHLLDHPGTSLRFLTGEAEGNGADATVRAVWRHEVPYGFVSTPGGSLNVRTVAADRLVPHLEHLWRTDPRARELWAASTTTVSDAWQYLRHQIEGTPVPYDLSPAKQAWLDAQLGLGRSGEESPLFASAINGKLADFVGDYRVDQVSGLDGSSGDLQFSPSRRQKMGRTPSKYSPTGLAVFERMRKEGLIIGDGPLLPGNPHGLMFIDTDGQIRLIDHTVDMAHLIAVVHWWNDKGWQFGERSTQGHKFMHTSDNYILQHQSINRAAGAGLKETYRDAALVIKNEPRPR